MRGFLSLLFFLTSLLSFAQVAERPSPQKLYNNLSTAFPDFLKPDEAQSLESKLESFSRETSNQICVVIVDDLNGMDANEYATKLGETWGVGKKGSNNGIVILIKPTNTDGGRDLAIAVGYGLEGAIPDLATKRIMDRDMLPDMKAGNYYAAVDKGSDVLMKLAKGEINAKDYSGSASDDWITWLTEHPLLFIIIILIIVFILKAISGGGGGGYTYSRGGGYWGGGFGGGSSWGGSSGGGGWGGFGGGSFGGGGSSSKW